MLPDDAAVQTNLSAAYLARARWWNHPEDWPKALAAAERAIALEPNAPEPYFNRALALEGLEQNDARGAGLGRLRRARPRIRLDARSRGQQEERCSR